MRYTCLIPLFMIQLNKGGDYVEHFIEAVAELLFGFVKSKPDKRPTIELKNRFVISYDKTTSIILLLLLFLAGTAFLVFSFVTDKDTKILFIIFSGLFFLVFFLFSFVFSFKYYVTPETIQKTVLFAFKKIILWEDIICVRIIEKSDEREVTIALYNKDKKCVSDIGTNMENAWRIVDMAEYKNIEIRKEKDLTIEQIQKL